MQITVNNQKINVKECTNILDRFKGLMFKETITPLYFPHCNSIHTFFMKKNIDIIMTDKENKVISIYKNVKKNRIIINRKAYNTLELPIDTYKIELNETII